MAAETFFARWSRVKAENREQETPPAVVEQEAPPPPTMEDAQALTTESDFKPFFVRGVDDGVRRTALKKLFADPHFNTMDGLDTYIDDYNKFEPLTPLMLAALNHAKDLIAREFAEPDENEPKDQDL